MLTSMARCAISTRWGTDIVCMAQRLRGLMVIVLGIKMGYATDWMAQQLNTPTAHAHGIKMGVYTDWMALRLWMPMGIVGGISTTKY